MLPLIANVSLGVGALSYAGQFAVTVVADRDTYPDLAAFTTGVHDDLYALGAGQSLVLCPIESPYDGCRRLPSVAWAPSISPQRRARSVSP